MTLGEAAGGSRQRRRARLRTAIRRRIRAARDHRHEPRRCAASSRGDFETDAGGAPGRGRLRAADRLRQRRQSAPSPGRCAGEQELALRTALGAGRGRLLRQLLTESVILAVAGGVAGLMLAAVASELLVSYVSRYTLRASEIRIDATVLYLHARRLARHGHHRGACCRPWRADADGGPGRVTHTAPASSPAMPASAAALIVAQVAASFMLLIGAGLTIRSLMKLTGVDPGFSTDQVLAMQLDMNFSKYTTARSGRRFWIGSRCGCSRSRA